MTDGLERKNNNMSPDPEGSLEGDYHALQFDDIYDISLDQNFKKHGTYTETQNKTLGNTAKTFIHH